MPLCCPGLTEYSPIFQRLPVSGRSSGPFYVSLTGLGVSPGGFLENGLIQGQISYQTFQAGVLLFQLFETLCLVYPHPAILFTPAVISAVANPNLFQDYGKDCSLTEQYFSFAEFTNNLFRLSFYLFKISPN